MCAIYIIKSSFSYIFQSREWNIPFWVTQKWLHLWTKIKSLVNFKPLIVVDHHPRPLMRYWLGGILKEGEAKAKPSPLRTSHGMFIHLMFRQQLLPFTSRTQPRCEAQDFQHGKVISELQRDLPNWRISFSCYSASVIGTLTKSANFIVQVTSSAWAMRKFLGFMSYRDSTQSVRRRW